MKTTFLIKFTVELTFLRKFTVKTTLYNSLIKKERVKISNFKKIMRYGLPERQNRPKRDFQGYLVIIISAVSGL